jgi:hypothetical protein
MRSTSLAGAQLKRQYYGIHTGTWRYVLVHAFRDYPDRKWRSEVIMVMDGGCGNAWFRFDVESRRVVSISCAGSA